MTFTSIALNRTTGIGVLLLCVAAVDTSTIHAIGNQAPAKVSRQPPREADLVGFWTRRGGAGVVQILLEPGQSYVRMFQSDDGLHCDKGRWRIEPERPLVRLVASGDSPRVDPAFLSLRSEGPVGILGYTRARLWTTAARDEWKKSLVRPGCFTSNPAGAGRDGA